MAKAATKPKQARAPRVIRTSRERISVRVSARQWRHVLNVIVSQSVHCSPCGGASDGLRDTFRVPDSAHEYVTISYTPADESEA